MKPRQLQLVVVFHRWISIHPTWLEKESEVDKDTEYRKHEAIKILQCVMTNQRLRAIQRDVLSLPTSQKTYFALPTPTNRDINKEKIRERMISLLQKFMEIFRNLHFVLVSRMLSFIWPKFCSDVQNDAQ
ncbi:hypothetical protein Tco_0568284 [Tanacetum coccineum]